jgi:hypothetical protein
MYDGDGDLTGEETTSYVEHNSPRGAASYTQREVSEILKRSVSKKTTNWVNAVTRDQTEEGLQLLIRMVVEKLPTQTNHREEKEQLISQEAARLRAAGMKTSDSVFAAAARVLRQTGWSTKQVARALGEADRRLLQVDDLVVTVIPLHDCGRAHNHADEITVWVDGERREAKLFELAGKPKLRITLYETDSGKLLEVRGAALAATRGAEKDAEWVSLDDPRRLKILDAHRALLTTGQSFELFRLLKKAEFAEAPRAVSGPPSREPTVLNSLWRTCSIEKLPITHEIMYEAGVLQKVKLLYAQKLREKLDASSFRKRLEGAKDGEAHTKTPRLLAEEALLEADAEVFAALPWHTRSCIRRLALEKCSNKSDLKTAGLSGAVVRSELKGWRK